MSQTKSLVADLAANAGFRSLVAKAHKKGLRVDVDALQAYAASKNIVCAPSTVKRARAVVETELGNPGTVPGGAFGMRVAPVVAPPLASEKPARIKVRIAPDVQASARMDAAVFDALGLGKPARATAASPATSVRLQSAPPPYDPLVDGKNRFDELAARSDDYLEARRAQPPDAAVYEIDSDAPILLTHFSDFHIGGRGTDHALGRQQAELLRDTPGAFALFGGDGIDNFIKHHAAMINSDSTPQEQYAALTYWLNIFGPSKMLGGISGNHDYWTKGFAGVDYLRDVFGRLGIVYSPHRLRLTLRVNKIEYRVELRHTFRFKSSINLSNQLLRMWEHSDWEWHIGMVGHTHDGPFVFPFDRHGTRRWGSLAGSMKIADPYSEQWGFNAAQPHSPSFILNHKAFGIMGFDDLAKGVDVLNALRARG